MVGTSEPERPVRADAVRNRSRILQAAARSITALGPEVGMAEIAKSAGVAVGTLYRHFPTKTDLIAAVMADYVTQVAGYAEEALARARGADSPLAQIVVFLERATESTATIHAVKLAGGGGIPGYGAAQAEQRAVATVSELIQLAKDAGEIDAHIAVEDLYLLVGSAPYDQPAAARERWLELVIPGLIRPFQPETRARG